ncbi:hypothetical protein GXM_00026 [Nostoc sphaeroides CCNUC1]|uniref:Uncharacterized protein n=1 Tax=Nostoc sphaeroides CCNUC1 TaxID=2653204 RepID=A0A5P8VQ28_9NOSO|nr:hypothetical protein GXM_00026 [Nostoc sphaeroides CCNUC1]
MNRLLYQRILLTNTKPRLLFTEESVVSIAFHKSAVFTQTGGYLERETSRIKNLSVCSLYAAK